MVRASVRLPVVRWASVITLVRPLLLVGILQVPPSAKTASSFPTRPRLRSAAAVKSLAVEPGSNGSVKVEARAEPAACLEASASSSPLRESRKTTSPPSARMSEIACSSPRSAIS